LHGDGFRKLLIIPIFIPHLGCPHRCIFCRQETITSQTRPLKMAEVRDSIERAIHSPGFDPLTKPEVAFYGGTFTGLPEKRMEELLDTVKPYIRKGLINSIRISTRPDFLYERHMEFLRDSGVSTVEIGAQSMDDRVLGLSKRGHSAEDTIRAVRLLRQYGFKVGIQLMPGLPGDSESGFLRTIDTTVDLRPDMARIYPALVIRGTELENQYLDGRYRPLSLEEAVSQCEESCIRLEGNGIPVIRIGILNAPSLAETGEIVAGPWHASFGYLVRCRIYWRRIENFLPAKGEAEQIEIRVSRRELPLVRGFRNAGVRMIEEKTGARITKICPDDSLASGEIVVEKL
jgi:histone acetyltransferase (RNA polymerase elongator complex component)